MSFQAATRIAPRNPRQKAGRVAKTPVAAASQAPSEALTSSALSMKLPASATPEALVRQAAGGDREAAGLLYDRFAGHLLGLIQRILPATEESERVLEDVFLKLWRESPALARSRGSIAAWLTLAARARAADRLRAQSGRGSRRASSAALREMLLWLPTPKDVALLEERRALLQKVLGQLPPSQSRALEGIMFGGLTEVELAAQGREPLARVRSELRAATRFLKHRRRAVVGSWTVTI